MDNSPDLSQSSNKTQLWKQMDNSYVRKYLRVCIFIYLFYLFTLYFTWVFPFISQTLMLTIYTHNTKLYKIN